MTSFKKQLRPLQAPVIVKYESIKTRYWDIWVQPASAFAESGMISKPSKISFWDVRFIENGQFVDLRDMPDNTWFHAMSHFLHDDFLYKNVPTEYVDVLFEAADLSVC